jgi:UDP:flavonoid glycosyltransferase YjiC (YdhE family)
LPTPSPKHILIAPLDWGTGHTTRCIPLIRHLLAHGQQVTMAGNSVQENLIKKNFPDLNVVRLNGYNVTYSKRRSSFLPKLLLQLPRLAATVREEHQWLCNYVRDHQVDGIISDNRYGCYHHKVPSVILTHQLQIMTGMGAAADKLLRQLHYKYLARFQECWVPDVPGSPNLAGNLSHPSHLPHHTHYIGMLSQMQPGNTPTTTEHLLIVLSGPEPQRSQLSDLLWKSVQNSDQRIVFVEGSAAIEPRTSVPAHIQYHLQLGAAALQPLMEQAHLVICRSGYSTLMDLVLLNKKALLIPTPGQTEQEYLAHSLQQQGIFMAARQSLLQLNKELAAVASFPFQKLALPGGHQQFVPTLDRWIHSLP